MQSWNVVGEGRPVPPDFGGAPMFGQILCRNVWRVCFVGVRPALSTIRLEMVQAFGVCGLVAMKVTAPEEGSPWNPMLLAELNGAAAWNGRSEERRVGEECRPRG